MTFNKWHVRVVMFLFFIGAPAVHAQDFLKQLEAKLFQKQQESKAKDQTSPATDPSVKESSQVPFELPGVLEPQGEPKPSLPAPGLLRPRGEAESQELPAPKIETKGLNIVAMKMLKVTPALSKQHYAEHVTKPFYPNLESFITSSPIVALALEGLEAIRVVRDMLGATNGLKAAPGTIRGDFSSSRQMNLVHASDSEESATRELALYFQPSELCEYTPTLVGSFRASDET